MIKDLNSKNFLYVSSLIIIFGICVFLTFYKLSESPPTWMDEGIIIQTSRAFLDTGYPLIPVAPNVYESAGIVTTSYPVTFPIAMSFKLFGPGLLQARLVMVVYLLLLFIVSFLLFKKFLSKNWHPLSFALLITFAPLYGHGKNVLGEVPGIFFFCLFLFFLYQMENGKLKFPLAYWTAGLFVGLFVATKPIFIVILPALLVAFTLKKYWLMDNWVRELRPGILVYFFTGLILPIITWILIQFSGDSIAFIWDHYTNPYKIDVWAVIYSNLKLFYSDTQPLYFFCLFFVWTMAFLNRLIKRENVPVAELVAYIFSLLIFLAFFRTPGYYRYFFPAQIIAIIYFVPSFIFIVESIKSLRGIYKKILILIALLVLMLLQAYGLIFTSWVTKSYGSNKTQNMKSYFSKISSDNIFLYQVPEVAIFLQAGSFYQFFSPAPNFFIGEKSLEVLRQGLPELVIINSQIEWGNYELFTKYEKLDTVDRYVILKKNNKK